MFWGGYTFYSEGPKKSSERIFYDLTFSDSDSENQKQLVVEILKGDAESVIYDEGLGTTVCLLAGEKYIVQIFSSPAPEGVISNVRKPIFVTVFELFPNGKMKYSLESEREGRMFQNLPAGMNMKLEKLENPVKDQ